MLLRLRDIGIPEISNVVDIRMDESIQHGYRVWIDSPRIGYSSVYLIKPTEISDVFETQIYRHAAHT